MIHLPYIKPVVLKMGFVESQGSFGGSRGPQQKGEYDRTYDYFGHGFHILSVVKHLKAKMGDHWTTPYQIKVCGLICVS